MQVFYTDGFVLPLPEGHRFPMSKYSRLRAAVLSEGIVPAADLQVPLGARDDQLELAHTADYVRRATTGGLSAAEVRRIGFPWSPQMVERSRRSVGGTLAACRAGLVDGVGVSLAGGTHHAGPDFGEGYCMFNDAVVALRVLQREGRISRAAVIDVDVHQGNGTAAITAGDDSIFTCSLHGARNFPLRKVASDLDVALPDGTEDAAYLAALDSALEETLRRSSPELVVMLAGADPFVGDRLGRLSLSKAGLAARDARVLAACRGAGAAVAVVMAGGYADVEDVVAIHLQTVREAARWAGQLAS